MLLKNHSKYFGHFGQRMYLPDNELEMMSEVVSEVVRTVRTCPNCPNVSERASGRFRTLKPTERQAPAMLVRTVRTHFTVFHPLHTT